MTDPTTATADTPLQIVLRPEHYPFWAGRSGLTELKKVEFFVAPGGATPATVELPNTDGITADGEYGGMRVGELADDLPAMIGPVSWAFGDNSMEDIWVALTWGEQT